MPLQHFLTATARTDDQELRRAMAAALALEIPHNPAEYERFYESVIDLLLARAESPVDAALTPPGGRLTAA